MGSGEKALQAAGVGVHPDSPGTFEAVMLVTSAALAAFGAFLAVASVIWGVAIYGPRDRASQVWKTRREGRVAVAPAVVET